MGDAEGREVERGPEGVLGWGGVWGEGPPRCWALREAKIERPGFGLEERRPQLGWGGRQIYP